MSSYFARRAESCLRHGDRELAARAGAGQPGALAREAGHERQRGLRGRRRPELGAPRLARPAGGQTLLFFSFPLFLFGYFRVSTARQSSSTAAAALPDYGSMHAVLRSGSGVRDILQQQTSIMHLA
jgi:hypothetical protein